MICLVVLAQSVSATDVKRAVDTDYSSNKRKEVDLYSAIL